MWTGFLYHTKCYRVNLWASGERCDMEDSRAKVPFTQANRSSSVHVARILDGGRDPVWVSVGIVYHLPSLTCEKRMGKSLKVQVDPWALPEVTATFHNLLTAEIKVFPFVKTEFNPILPLSPSCGSNVSWMCLDREDSWLTGSS